MIESIKVQDFVGPLAEWLRAQSDAHSQQENCYVHEFASALKRSNVATPVGIALVWSEATDGIAAKIRHLELPVEYQRATFARMAIAVFPADFAAEATRLVRNEPKRASDPTLERIADALECLALGAMAVAPNSDKSREFLDVAGGAAVRVMANAARSK